MIIRLLAVLIIAAVACITPVAGQNGDNPTVAVLRYGGTPEETTFSEYGVLDMLQATGMISADERVHLDTRQDLEGENINIFWGDGGWDLALVNLMVDDALGRGADVLIALTTPVARAAANATSDLDDAPPVLFASVFSPTDAGIAESSCDKQTNVTGSVIVAPYQRTLALLGEQNPDMSSIGILSSSTEISGLAGGDTVEALAGELGLEVKRLAVNTLSDFPLAAQALADEFVDAIVAPIDAVTAQALPVLSGIANENGIPFVYPILGSVYHGATFGVGFMAHYEQGLHLGRLLTGVLAGELDTEMTGIRSFSGEGHSVNLDAADEQGITIVQALVDTADIVISGGGDAKSAAFDAAYRTYSMDELRSDEVMEMGAGAIASLNCGG